MHRGDFRRNCQMSKATEQIVQVYVRHQNRGALEDLRKQRQKLALELWARARPGHDFGLPIRQINEDIAVIEGGPKRRVTGAKSLGQSWGGPACVRLASGRELVGVARAFGMVHGAILRTSPRQSSTFTAPTESR
jgi:hypothetical protein